jgi:hypothetical protein
MSKFQVGDLVFVAPTVGDYDDFSGLVGRVTEIKDVDIFISPYLVDFGRFEGLQDSYYFGEEELEIASDFQVGDRVRVVFKEDVPAYTLAYNGREGTVARIYSSGKFRIIVNFGSKRDGLPDDWPFEPHELELVSE